MGCKNWLIVAAAAVILTGAAGGSMAVYQHGKAQEDTAAPQQTVSTLRDLTVQVNPVDPTGKTVQEVYAAQCIAHLYTGPEDLAAHADTIVHGKVEAVTFFIVGHSPWNKMDVLVTEVIKGDCKPGDKISVCQYGGYMPLAEQIRLENDGERFAAMTQEEINRTVLKKTSDGAPFPEAGQTAVFFAGKPVTRELPQGSYEVVSSYQSVYYEKNDGILERYAPTPGMYAAQGNGKNRSALLENGEQPYTLSQMKATLTNP